MLIDSLKKLNLKCALISSFIAFIILGSVFYQKRNHYVASAHIDLVLSSPNSNFLYLIYTSAVLNEFLETMKGKFEITKSEFIDGLSIQKITNNNLVLFTYAGNRNADKILTEYLLFVKNKHIAFNEEIFIHKVKYLNEIKELLRKIESLNLTIKKPSINKKPNADVLMFELNYIITRYDLIGKMENLDLEIRNHSFVFDRNNSIVMNKINLPLGLYCFYFILLIFVLYIPLSWFMKKNAVH